MAGKNPERKRRETAYEEGFRVLQGDQEYVTYLEDSSLRVWYSDVPWRYDNHVHTAVEVVLTLEGAVDYTVGNDQYRVRKDEVLIVPSGVPHSLNMGEESSRLLFLFEPDMMHLMGDLRQMSRSLNRVFYLHDGSEAHTRIRDWLTRIASIYREQDFMWNTLCYSYILKVYATLCQSYLSVSQYQRKKKDSRGMESQVVSMAMNYINSHYREDLTLDEVADFTGFSRYYFSRSFREESGFTFRDYLVRKRVQAAMTLLIETDKPMSEVAEESGFGSVASFNRVFREHKKCTPSQYRILHRKV